MTDGANEAPPARPLVERVGLGAYIHLDATPYRDPVPTGTLTAMEAALGGRFDLVHYFFTWGRAFGEAVSANLQDRALMLSMKPDGDLVKQVRDGRQDGYIDRFARDAKAFGRPVYLRYGHEMNGFWMDYSSAHEGGPSAGLRRLVAASRRPRRRCRSGQRPVRVVS